MQNLISDLSNVTQGVYYAFIAVCVLFGIVSLISFGVEIYLYSSYHRSNRRKTTTGLTGEQVARNILDGMGLVDVQVKKAGWIWAAIWGNSYSRSRHTVYLRRGIFNKTSITASAVAAQKCGLAKQDADGDKTFKSRYWWGAISLLGPTFSPLIVIAGVLIDILVFNFTGIASIVSAAIALVVIFLSAGFTFVQIPIEKKGVEFAREKLSSMQLLNGEEMEIADRYFKAYIIDFIFAAIMKVFEIIRAILRVVLSLLKNSSK